VLHLTLQNPPARVLVNSEEFSAKTSKGIISKGTHVRVTETDALTLLVEKS